MISEKTLCSVFIENLRGVGSPSNAGKPLRSFFLSLHLLFTALCFFLSSHPLVLTFTTRNPRCGLLVTVFLCRAAGLCGLMFLFLFLLVPLIYTIFLHSGVTLFHSPTQGITSLKGIVVDLVGSCTETLQCK